jgi:hypothetical protein
MPMTPAAAKKYKPRRPDVTIDDVITPETRAKMREAKSEAADAKTAADTEAAYNKASGMKKGGYVKAADGCCTKGKTRGTMVKMAGGGYC